MAVIDSALVALGYVYNDAQLRRFQSDMDSLNNVMGGLLRMTGIAAAAVTGFTVASAKSSDALLKQAQGIGIAVEQLDALHHVATITMGDADTLNSSLEQLTVNISNAARGVGSSISAFSRLNVRTRDTNGQMRNTVDVLLDIANNLNRVQNRAEQIAILEELGFSDPRAILLFEQGREGIEKLVSEAEKLGVVTALDAKAAAEFNDQWARTSRVLRSAGRSFATAFLPLLESAAKATQEFLQENKELIKLGIDKFIEGLEFVFKNIETVLVALVAVNLKAWVAAATFAFRGLFIALLPLIAKFTALFLIIDDLMKFFKGEDSLTGRLAEWLGDTRILDPFFEWIDNKIEMIKELRKNLEILAKPIRELLGIPSEDEVVNGTSKTETGDGKSVRQAALDTMMTAATFSPFGILITTLQKVADSLSKDEDAQVSKIIDDRQSSVINQQNINVTIDSVQGTQEGAELFAIDLQNALANQNSSIG